MYKKLIVIMFVIFALGNSTSAVRAGKSVSQGGDVMNQGKDNTCTTIQSGTLYAADGSLIKTGNDQFGYNYQAHLFNGRYCDYDRVLGGEFCDVDLIMKWNDAWLSNRDCDGDGLLDRHYGSDSYIGSGAWETNLQSGSYEMEGQTCKWNYFAKIIAVPADATLSGGVWYSASGKEIGLEIWNQFAIILEIENDPCAGLKGVKYISPDHAGFGGW